MRLPRPAARITPVKVCVFIVASSLRPCFVPVREKTSSHIRCNKTGNCELILPATPLAQAILDFVSLENCRCNNLRSQSPHIASAPAGSEPESHQRAVQFLSPHHPAAGESVL